ncbi:MAG: GIY-YIG nuclease family protein [Chloroflexi bacterium]|nr:GIY-YIG nuclease family protein [Chloroflexota bacterium]
MDARIRTQEIPREPGTYALIFHVTRTCTCVVGKRGTVTLSPGYYVYVGSAHGPGGLAARLRRHLREGKRLHWHIDYITQHVAPVAVLYAVGREPQECMWVQQVLDRPGTLVPMFGLGSGDCRSGCPAHFLRVTEETLQEMQAWGTMLRQDGTRDGAADPLIQPNLQAQGERS